MQRTEANKQALRSLVDRLQDVRAELEEIKGDTEAISKAPDEEDKEMYEKLVDDIEHLRELSKVIEGKIKDQLT
jgi:rubrerythrin